MDVGDQKQVTHKKAKHKLDRQQELEELKDLLSRPGGRAFIWRLITECKVTTFGYCGDNNQLNHQEGQRRVGGWVIAELDAADPKAYSKMRDEAVSRDIAKERN